MPGSVITIRDHPGYAWGIGTMRAAGLVALIYAVCTAVPRPGWHGRPLAIAVVLALGAAGWVCWMLAERRRRLVTGALTVMAVSGGVLGALTPNSPAIAIGAVAALAAGGMLAVEASIAVTAAGALALAAVTLAIGGATPLMLGYLVLLGAGLGAGLIRLGYTQRADQAERLLEQTRRAHQAEAEAAALAERTRIAREIHDVLAHSLGALAMQLEAAQALLAADSLPRQDPSLAKAQRCVDRAGQLAREGLAETRRAILALRQDTASLPELLTTLASAHRTDDRSPVEVATSGTPRPLAADANLALYRTAQEALTNAAKHAPGRPVTLRLEYSADQVVLTATNPLPADSQGPMSLAATGAGYGLTGLRERAELAGGSLTADVLDNIWCVCVRIPT